MAEIIKYYWYRVVKFENGMYGIRRWLFGWEYLDFTMPRGEITWHSRDSNWFRDCQHENLEGVQQFYTKKFLTPKKPIDYGTPV